MSAKPKILCLHGYAQTVQAFRHKTGAFRKLFKFVDFDFLESPLFIDPKNESAGKQWYIYDKNDAGWKQNVKYISDYIQKEGPFQGILGFSQGATMASFVCLIQSLLREPNPNEHVQKLLSNSEFKELQKLELSYCISIGGYFPENSEVVDILRDYKIKIPSVHIYGLKDEIIVPERSKKLRSVFQDEDSIEIPHSQGHKVPHEKKVKEELLKFLKKFNPQVK